MKKNLALILTILIILSALTACGKSSNNDLPIEDESNTENSDAPAICTEHSGGIATCKEKAICSICSQEYGELDPNNHTEDTNTVQNNKSTHKKIFTCCNAIIEEMHLWNKGLCSTCNQDYVASKGLEFKKSSDNTSYYVSGIGTCTDNEIYISYTNEGLPVIGIYDAAFKNNSTITNIIIPDSITHIGTSAFYGCNALINATIPSSITNIGADAFKYCDGITNVYYNGKIDNWCNINFYNSYSNPTNYIKNLYLTNSNEKYNLLTKLVIPSTVTEIKHYAFYNYNNLESITIPDSVTSIGNEAFNNCKNLMSVTIGNGVTSIGNYAFSNCKSLSSIVIGNNVISIGIRAFYHCNSLTSISIPEKVTDIGESAFKDCYKLIEVINTSNLNIEKNSDSHGYVGYYALNIHNRNSKIIDKNGYLFYTYEGKNYLIGYTGISNALNLPNGYNNQDYEIYKYAFLNCNNITSINIPNSITNIGKYAFSGCNSLTNVTIGKGLTNIGKSAFSGCNSLTSIKIPDSVISIGDYSFEYCSSLTSVTIGNKVTSIGNYSFEYCTSLSTVTIGNAVSNIGDSAFRACTSLTNITIPESMMSIGNYAFEFCTNLTSVTIPNNITSIGDYAFDDTKLSGTTYGNAIYLGNEKNPYLYLLKTTSKNVSSVNIHIKTKFIASQAFYKCTELMSVIIPDSVTSIGASAFHDCTALTSINIPDSVSSIGWGTFYNCTELASVSIGKGVTGIDWKTFYGCTGLTSITIPSSITSIADHAFDGCTNLANVVFENTEGWKADDTSIFSTDLEDKAKAAKYLTDTYDDYTWTRN